MLLAGQIFFAALIAYFGLYLGIIRDFFDQIWWWDIPMHFLIGVWAAFLGAWLFMHWRKRLFIAECILFAFVFGVAWEIFEVLAGIGGSPFMGYWLDTTKDLFMDSLGGAFAGVLIVRFVWKRK